MIYAIANNTGDGFVTHDDRKHFEITGYVNTLWVLEDNEFSRAWISRNNATEITKNEAQTLLDTAYSELLDPVTHEKILPIPRL